MASKVPLFVLFAAMTLVVTTGHAQLGFLVINEMDCDQAGTDAGEFIELYDGGLGGQSLAGYCIVFYNGGAAGDASYFAMDLTGSTDVNGYYLIGNTGVLPAPVQTWADNTLQNGADAIALYFAAASSFPNGTLPTTTNLVDAVVYDTSDPDDAALIAALTPGQPQVNEDANLMGISESIGRCPNGSGGTLTTTGWVAFSPSPNSSNICPTYGISISQIGGCGTPITLSVMGAAAGVEMFNVISLACSTPPGSGPLFGLSVGAGSGDPLSQFFFPLGSVPFHVNADGSGNYSASFPTTGCPGLVLNVEAVNVQVLGFTVLGISPTTGCVTVSI
jgi:hypothetical protein